MKPTIRIAQRACEAAKARQAIVQRRGELDGWNEYDRLR